MLTKRYILLRLHHAMLVCATFGLHRNDKLAAMSVDADVDLVNFNLTNTFYCRSKVVLL